ncbi:MAG TPA: DUF4352 domain-containing protein [Mycobacteriales bacterium]|nr:DUF4352 domain-containing protein [Mycobacteriales bacterium]
MIAFPSDPSSNQPQPTGMQPIVVQQHRSKVRWIVGGVIAGVVLLSCCGIGTIALLAGSDSNSEKHSSAKEGSEAVVGQDETARDGKFEFTVQKLECGKKSAGGDFLNKQAQGQFCFVTMKVKNIGNESRMFDASNQQAFNDADAQYEADSVASTYANQNGEAFLNNINPGNEVTGIVVFDIPQDQKISKFKLHDSAFSNGVSVKLS